MALKRWAIAGFSAPATTELMEAAVDKETVLLSLLVSNFGSVDAEVTVEVTNGVSTIYTMVFPIPAGSAAVAIDSKIVLEPGDTIDVTSDADDVSVLASGDES